MLTQEMTWESVSTCESLHSKRMFIRPSRLSCLLRSPKSTALNDVRACSHCRVRKERPMLWTLFVIVVGVWLLGLVTAPTLGGFLHLLLRLAVVILVMQRMQGRTPSVEG